jgi:FlaA1/EpsC-like NDP-sugar epimerase
VTVTHPEMRRYFMTIPEAVQLVLEASPLGKGGEIFLLDMGEPVRIVDLAKNMIRLSGRNPEEIPIRFTGIRPGEKLFEELHTEGENIVPTRHPKIKIFSGYSPAVEEMQAWVQRLKELIANRDEKAVVAHMAAVVPEYTPSEQWKSSVSMAAGAMAN